MYSKAEASQLRQEFWTSFGQYMQPIPSADGEKASWVNYKTGEKGIQFRMYADNKSAFIAIELNHQDAGLQEIYFEQFRQVRSILERETGEEWNWAMHIYDENDRIVSRIYTDIENVSVLKKNDWSTLITFFKPRILALDRFWSEVKYGFEALR